MSLKIFICYAHEDEQFLNKLKSHLRPLQEEGLIKIWNDRDISAGKEWEKEIRQQLDVADIILLMVSADFMNSKYCYSVEMKRAIERHECGEAKVIPIILRDVYWQGILGKLQALPIDARSITGSSWHSLDEAFYSVTKSIQATAKILLKERHDRNFDRGLSQRRRTPPNVAASLTLENTYQDQSIHDTQFEANPVLPHPLEAHRSMASVFWFIVLVVCTIVLVFLIVFYIENIATMQEYSVIIVLVIIALIAVISGILLSHM